MAEDREDRLDSLLPDLSLEDRLDITRECLDGLSPFVITDIDGHIVFANRHAAKLLGIPQTEVRGKEWVGIFFPENRRGEARAGLRRMADGTRAIRLKAPYSDPNGLERILIWNGTRLDWTGPEASLFMLSATDVTDMERNAARLDEAAERLEQVLHGAKLGMWDWDIPSGTVTMDGRWMGMLGYLPDEYPATIQALYNLVHPDDLRGMTLEQERHFRGDIPHVQSEVRIKAKNGTWRWVLSRGHVVKRSRDGTPKRMIGTILDTTREKRAEKELRESRERLELALKGADIGMWDWIIPIDRLDYSERWASMLGYDVQDLKPSLETFKSLLHPDDKAHALESIRRHQDRETPFFQDEFRLRAKDGGWRWILARGMVVERTEDGAPMRMTSTHLDITDRKEFEMKLQERIEMEELLASITFYFINTTPETLGRATEMALRGIGEFLDADRGYIHMMDDSGKAVIKGRWCSSREGCAIATMAALDLQSLPWFKGILGEYLTVRLDAMDDLPKDAREEIAFFRDHGVKALLAAPILLNKACIGFLGFDRLTARAGWSDQDAILIESAANVFSQALESARQAEELNRTLRIKEALAALYPPLIDPKSDLTSISDIVMKHAKLLTRSPHGFVGTIDPETRVMLGHTLSRMMENECGVPGRQQTIAFPPDEAGVYPGIWGMCLNTMEPHVSNRPDEDPVSVGIPEGHLPVRRFMAVPVILDGLPAGIIGLANKEEDYGEGDVDAVSQMAAYMALAIQRRMARKRMLQSEARFHQVVETMNDGLVISDEYGKITYANQRFADMLGYEQKEILGRTMTEFLSSRGQDEAPDGFRSREDLENFSMDLALETRDGKPVFCILSPATIKDDSGAFMGTFSVVHDVTERRILEGQLVQAQKLESIGQLAAGIAHEINTPTQYVANNVRFLEQSLDAIKELIAGFQELAEKIRSGQDAKEALEAAEEILEAAQPEFLMEELPEAIAESLEGVDRISAIVQSVKKFAHPGKEEKIPADINEAIKSTVTVSTNEWKYVARVETDLDPEMPPVPCLLGEFNQVLLNLIINASHAIQDVVGDSGGQGLITISSKKLGGFAEIRVSDTGTGIPAEIRTKIFDPFFTTKEVGRGTGQGLAISNRVIREKHGGTLDFVTTPGQGTTFIIRLPLDLDEEGTPQ